MKMGTGAALAVMLALGGCQTQGWTYTKVFDGPPLEYAEAKCNILAPGVDQGYIAVGSASYVAGAGLGNALGNAIREAEFKKNCMMLQGWKQDTAEIARAKWTAARKMQAASYANIKAAPANAGGKFPRAPKPYGT